jgi:outer membrane protein assembly factor BamB
MKPWATVAWLACLLVGRVAAEEWKQFRGPDGLGVSSETGLPIRWSQTENLRWKVTLPGRGLSCPVIAAGKVYATASSGYLESRLHVSCLEEATGKLLWERQFWSTGLTVCHPKTCMAAPTPVTDGERIYVLFATGDLIALDAEGNLLWYRSLSRDYPTIGNNVGMAASPVLYKDVLILPLENAGDSFVAGLNKFTGQNRWRHSRPRVINWITPLVFMQGNRPAVICQCPEEIVAYDPELGTELWKATGDGYSPVASPVAGKGLLMVATGDVLALRARGEKQPPEVVWHAPKLKPSYSSPLFYRDYVYAVNSAGVLNCAEASTGKGLWQERLNNKGPYWASPIAADGKIYLINDSGVASVVEAGSQPRILAVNKLEETVLATPAIAGGALYLRSDQHLFCFAVNKKQ